MKKLILIAIAAAGGTVVYKLLNPARSARP